MKTKNLKRKQKAQPGGSLEPVGSVDWSAPVPELKGSFPIVLYFATAAERDDFIRMVQEVQPGLVSRPLPNK